MLDYQHDKGEIGLMNFLSSSDTRAVNRGQTIRPDARSMMSGTMGGDEQHPQRATNLLSVKQEIPLFHVDLKLSHSYTENHSPEDLSFQDISCGAGYANMPNITKTVA